jgi:hypothetical protein
MKILWTFDNKEKLEPFVNILKEKDISYEIKTKNNEIDFENGLIVYVEENDYKNAKKLLMNHRKRITNRHNK